MDEGGWEEVPSQVQAFARSRSNFPTVAFQTGLSSFSF